MRRPRGKVVLVFGESDNDRRAIVEIARAIKPNAKVRFERREKPLVLLRETENRSTRDSTAEAIAKLVRAAGEIDDVVAVLAHRDCDSVEPAHIDLATTVEAELRKVGVKAPIAVTPAFELEAWWLLFPEAIHRTCRTWRRVDIGNRSVGAIPNAKEFLIRETRPTDQRLRNRCRDYRESDSIIISTHVRELGLLDNDTRKRSASLDHFCGKIEELAL